MLVTKSVLCEPGDLKIAKMVVHGDYVYIFGGYYLNEAEWMKIGEWRWSKLPSMKEGRYDFGVYESESRIYLIGGYYNTSIEFMI